MATKYWLGTATAVAQVHTASIDSVDATPANNTFTVTIGGVAISAVGDTDVATTATNLRASLNGSTHPYFAGITWSGTAGDIIGTADVAGVPFVAALTETGAGTGTVTDFAVTTASAGPCDWATADNWSDGSVPGSADTVIFADNSVNVCFGLDQNALAINDLFIEQTYTGKIGLNRNALITTADGETTDTTKPEYREDYLRIDVDTIEIGKHIGTGTATGSQRLKIDNTSTGASTTRVFNTANVGAEANLSPVRMLFNSTTADIFIRNGSVGFANDEPDETSIMGDLYVNGTTTRVFCGTDCQWQTITQTNGKSLIQSSTTVTSVDLISGTMTIEGDATYTTVNVEDGLLIPNHDKSAGVAITTLNINGGTVDGTRTSELRTWTTVNLAVGASLKVNSDVVTMTNFNDPSGEYTIQVS
jgi:hypothetical protein